MYPTIMEPVIGHNPIKESYRKPQSDYEKKLMCKTSLVTSVILALCLFAVLIVNIYPVNVGGKPEPRNSPNYVSNDSYHFNSMKPVQLEYIWPDNVEKIVEDILDNNMHVTNDDRAVLIKTELMRFKTNDVFYIMVYDHTQSPNNQAFHGTQSEYITVSKPGKSNVVIYRSHYWRGSPENALTTVTKEIEETCSKGINSIPENYTDITRELYKNFHDINFLGIIDRKLDVSVRSANSFGRARGPGYWDTIPVLDSKTKERTGKEFILIAGYK
ncbi:hypothetical protein CAEBREN_22595 [Caenorhabditis brenneri]|uniref:Uncharacterized protein n=1 Tax=Caenorhabditis brenneri TaxID=135651 RepID=G0PEK4_CAEBE|nr:hypothetical protein CAEBREN_22595 [Caenorhabditis brenneri]